MDERPSHERIAIDSRGSKTTLVEVLYPDGRGNVGLRGSAPLSWEETRAPARVEGDRHIFELEIADGVVVELKVVREDGEWQSGRNYKLHAGDHIHVEPAFDEAGSTLLDADEIDVEGEALHFRVLLPPSYSEQENKRYPVLYVQDGQSLWIDSEDPLGGWDLDSTLDVLFELGAMEEIIVVGIDTAERRMDRLSPSADPQHGGGDAERHLRAITDHLRPLINERFRTKRGREDTAVMGASMGGLFSFYAAWTRPDIFGKAACLSSSFWWAGRDLITHAQDSVTPEPRPFIYMDSGASMDPTDRDASARDGFAHTQSMHRALMKHGYQEGVDLRRLTFPGQRHDSASWAARIAIPLQLLFPTSAAASVPSEVLEAKAA